MNRLERTGQEMCLRQEQHEQRPWVRLYLAITAAAAELLQSCPTLCDPINGSPPGSPILGILQARTLEWVAISFSNGHHYLWQLPLLWWWAEWDLRHGFEATVTED